MIFLDKFLIHFDDHAIQYRTYDEEHARGIVFTVGEWTYDIVHNFEMGYRLLINSTKYEWKDLPFKEGMFHFLPEGIMVTVNG